MTTDQQSARPDRPIATEFFRNIPDLDWEDITGVHRVAAPVLAQIAGNRELMRELVLGARQDEQLWPKCEEGVVEDKIVLWDDPDRGYRLRLRMSTGHQEEMPHQHRFSFSNLVLRGTYLHRNYQVDGTFGEGTTVEDVHTLCVHEDIAGHCFTIHHDAVHSTPLPTLGTINLVLRGPAVKDVAPVLFVEGRGGKASSGSRFEEPETAERGHVFYRVGEKDESQERRSERRMSEAGYQDWVRRLEDWDLIGKGETR
ncbi:hypothetical protein ACFC6L_20330 [Kitasatospora phosalacinea]|uniref:hypothetical protein n=1 Tax=Kitasatospora phosalacinea TaxID=2065 RepID=UPI0035DD6D78